MSDVAIIDACIASDELDHLETRFALLESKVHLFLVVSSMQTFTKETRAGDPLKVLEDPNGRFAKWHAKIVRGLIPEFPPDLKDEWARENYQRNAIVEVVRQRTKARPGDIVMISDVDEYPNPAVIRPAAEFVRKGAGAVSFDQSFYYYSFAWKKKYTWRGTVMTTVEELFKRGAQYFRNGRDGWDAIQNGGVHLSYFGGSDAIVTKLKTFPHQEHRAVTENTSKIHENIQSGKDILGRGEREDLVRSGPPDWFPSELIKPNFFVVPEKDEDEPELP